MLKIFSHPRSGTHFLEAFVAKNFYPTHNLSVKNVEWGHWSNRKLRKENPYGELFGGHHLPTKRYRFNPSPLIYIYRDGRAVAYSVWKTPNFLNSEMSELSFSEFLRTPLDWEGSPGNMVNHGKNIIEHWVHHLESWFSLKGNVLMISYEELKDSPENIYNKIIQRCFPVKFFTGILNSNSDIKTIDEPIGLLPNKGTKNGWEEIFSDEDLNFFYENVPQYLLDKIYRKT